ncbi:MAG: MATE family efflux transporter, partial [Bacteroidota bacterium]|nr:MATE family efflux transporter [Bacteroidota bacterium]
AGNPMASAATQVIGAVINVALDPLFIFTFHLGVKGAALASVTAQFISCCWVLYYTFSYRSTLRVKKRNLKIQWSIIARIFAIGMSPFALQTAASAVSVVANNTLKTYGGDDAVGAMTIITSVSTLFIMPILGLNQGLQPIIGYNYGAKAYPRVKRALRNGVILATGYVLLCFAAVMLFPSNIVEFFIAKEANSMNLISIATHGIGIFFLALPILGIQIPCSNYFQCVGKAGVSMVISILRQVILLIPLYIIIPQFWGIDGIWYAAPISDFASVLITIAVIYIEMRRLNGKDREQVPVAQLVE